MLKQKFVVLVIANFVEVCHKSAPDHSECRNRNLMAFRKEFIHGNPAFNIPRLEPFAVENFIVSERSSSNQFQISATNVEVYNDSKYICYNYKLVFSYASRFLKQFLIENYFCFSPLRAIELAKEYTFNVNFKNVYLKATHNIDGQIIVLPIKGSGPMVATFSKTY